MSCDDLEMQIRFILFVLGQYTSRQSSFLQVYFKQNLPPYRPFRVGASVALIYYVFIGISTSDIRGYESKDIWVRDKLSFSYILAQLKASLIFSSELSIRELQAIVLDL